MEFGDIIVSAGVAGCVVVTRRVEAGYSVQLLEAGPKDHATDYRLHMSAAMSHVRANHGESACAPSSSCQIGQDDMAVVSGEFTASIACG